MAENYSALKRLREKAIKNIQKEEIGPSFDNVLSYSFDKNRNAINPKKMEELSTRFGYNSKIGCDTADGPCSCGSWHHLEDFLKDENIKPI